ncbi:hypothetical protein GCM10011297_32600 [Bacterioplanes sanyensis]|uniref:hypothetical protein n=1 Tax=Bacterioplanes sanyensis TaxID=1249553 RepID=UPI0016784D38|nr:hypothetical protein [Bacterioplanes sanyensis]GGY57323.1 hypothetical protein GCM10011297_32600 [Bacterioplanes sanyensis]
MNLQKINTIMLWSAIMLILFFVVAGAYSWGKEWASLVIGTMGALFTGTAALASAYSAKVASKSANQWRDIKKADQVTDLVSRIYSDCESLLLTWQSECFNHLKEFNVSEYNYKFDMNKVRKKKFYIIEIHRKALSKTDAIANRIRSNQRLLELQLKDNKELIDEWRLHIDNLFISQDGMRNNLRKIREVDNLSREEFRDLIMPPYYSIFHISTLQKISQKTYEKYVL